MSNQTNLSYVYILLIYLTQRSFFLGKAKGTLAPKESEKRSFTESGEDNAKKPKLEDKTESKEVGKEVGKEVRTKEVESKEPETKEPETKEVGSTKQTATDDKYQAELPYQALADVFEKIEGTTKRLEITKYTSTFYYDVLKRAPRDLPLVVYLFINRLGPDYEGLELGLGESLIIKALAEATGRSTTAVKADYQKVGDLGLVALQSRQRQMTMFAPKALTVREVFRSLTEIAKMSGQSSQNNKINTIKRMLSACKGNEAKFLVRSLEGKLRIGLAEKTVVTSVAQAFTMFENQRDGEPTPQEYAKSEEIVKEVYSQMPNHEIIINALIDGGIANLRDTCKIAPGVPLRPMLAKPTKSISEVLDRFSGEKFTCEYKYDGERAQVHMASDNTVKIYSRNMEDMTQRYPDVSSIVPKLLEARGATGSTALNSFILDCEAVAWDREQKKILPFQVLSTRKRKDVEEGSIKVRVCLFVFDMLYFNGRSMLEKSLTERRQLITENIPVVEGELQYATHLDSSNTEDIQTFLDQSVKDSCEGLMVKVLEGPESGYEPSKRSRNWLKLKKDYLDGVGDSLDLVVLGAYHGHGKRTNVYGGFLLGCFNPDSEEYETICKIGTGFSEADLEKFYKELSPTVIPSPKSYISYTAGAAPDVWFEPSMVWEVLTADLSLSPVYKAGIQELDRGVSLRFPRFLRLRDDKSPEDSTTSSEVVEMYRKQSHD